MPRQKPAPASRPVPPVTPLKRTAIIVRDMDRSLAFYHGVLGMNVWIQGSAGAEIPAMYQLLGMPPCTTRWIILQSEDVDWGMVGLFELTNPSPDDNTHPNIDRLNRAGATRREAALSGASEIALAITMSTLTTTNGTAATVGIGDPAGNGQRYYRLSIQ